MDSEQQQQQTDKGETKSSMIMYNNYVINLSYTNQSGEINITNIQTGLNYKQSQVKLQLFTFELMEKLLRKEDLINFTLTIEEKEKKIEIVMKFTASFLQNNQEVIIIEANDEENTFIDANPLIKKLYTELLEMKKNTQLQTLLKRVHKALSPISVNSNNPIVVYFDIPIEKTGTYIFNLSFCLQPVNTGTQNWIYLYFEINGNNINLFGNQGGFYYNGTTSYPSPFHVATVQKINAGSKVKIFSNNGASYSFTIHDFIVQIDEVDENSLFGKI